MSAYPKPDERKVNDPPGLILRYQANIRLGADFYFPDEFSQLENLLAGALERPQARQLEKAASLFDEVERRFDQRRGEVHGLIEGFLVNARHWARESEKGGDLALGLEQARCRLIFRNAEAALRQARQTLDQALTDLRRERATPMHVQGISSLTSRALPLARLYAFLDNARQTTTQHRYLALLPASRLQDVAQWLGAPLSGPDSALLVRAAHDRQTVSYLVCLNDDSEHWGEVLERLPRWEGCLLHREPLRQSLAAEVGLVEHLLRLIPRVHGEFILSDPAYPLVQPYEHLRGLLTHTPLPVDGLTAKRLIHRMIEGHA